LFVLDVRTGQTRTILRSTDWLNHLQFSPTDPALLLFCVSATVAPWSEHGLPILFLTLRRCTGSRRAPME
jgi:hypothetical protein